MIFYLFCVSIILSFLIGHHMGFMDGVGKQWKCEENEEDYQ